MTDPLQQPVEDRYPDGELPTEPPMEHPAFDPHTTWRNYWDHNPIHHGGRFVRWDEGDYWDIVEVTPPSAWPEPEHILDTTLVEPQDVWADPSDPLTDFSENMKKILRQFSGHPIHPNAEPFLSQVTYYACDWISYWGGGGRAETFDCRVEGGADDEYDTEKYWDTVSGYGVDPEDLVDDIAGSALPERLR